ncbi:LysM peptidoglycan-binding domain-containing protein [Clostridium sp. K25]|uniref:LysM peptidoglycan-binding domain-containing protein n=1 Tax=Clostridium sp. K25 TaxID=1443109 RepID=UPI00057D6787|nr:LysM peptidoglycan-binding domain-containing protein [Clostridium sp. K25]
MYYKMYLGINDGEEGFMLPVLPEKIQFNEDGDNKTFNIINLGEINTINKPKLTEISFESYFPLNYGPYVSVSSEKFFSPSFYISKIREWREKGQKIRFIFVGGPLEVNDLFTIENFKCSEEGGAVGDIDYSIELKRYRTFAAKKVTIVTKTNNTSNNKGKNDTNKKIVKVNSSPPRPNNKKNPNIYVVVSGDTLFHIAKKFLGRGSKWRQIYNLNKSKIKNPNMIYPGQELRLK